MNRAVYILLAALSVLLACFCIATAGFLPYTVVNIDTQKKGQQFTVEREYYGSTPFFKFIITDGGSPANLAGWEFSLKYGYSRDATAMVSFTGTNHVTVSTNQVLVNGTTNFFFEPRRGYYVALQGTYTNGGYSTTFAEGTMDVYYTPAGDPGVIDLENGITAGAVTDLTVSGTFAVTGGQYWGVPGAENSWRIVPSATNMTLQIWDTNTSAYVTSQTWDAP